MKRAIIYNRYMSGLGGGERSTFAYAMALRELGYEAWIVSDRELPAMGRVEATFGSEFSACPMRRIPEGGLADCVRSERVDLFVNHSFNSLDPNPARLGLYSMMFPAERVNPHNHPQAVRNLAGYDLLLNNSSFTKRYVDQFWHYPAERSRVLHPPIGRDMSARAARTAQEPPQKERIFLGIGRFAVYPANKNQKLMIESFLAAREKDSGLNDWKLVLVGNRNPDEDSERYFRECMELASRSGASVEILHDLPQPALLDLLERSFGYVHAAGAFQPPGQNPHQCEHLGLSIVEGMAYGCLPLLYARGGVYDILDVGTAGFPYATPEGLVEGFSSLAALHGTRDHHDQQMTLGRMAEQLSFERFTAGLAEAITSAEGRRRP